MTTEGNVWIFWAVFILLVLSFRKKKIESTEIMGLEFSSELKGLSILLVLMGHMTIFFGLLQMPLPAYIGAPAVEIFLFLSGYGLTASFCKNGMKHFARKRVSAVYIPFLTVNLIKIPFYLFWFSCPIIWLEIMKNITGISIMYDSTMWYVQFIFIWYFLFFIIFSIKKLPLAGKTALIFLCSIIMGIVFPLWSLKTSQTGIFVPLLECYIHFFGFALGVGAYVFCHREKKKELPIWVYPILSVVSLIVFYILSPNVPAFIYYVLSNVMFLIFAVTLFIFLRKLGLHSVLLKKLGDYAYHMYLNEFIVIAVIAQIAALNVTVKVLLIFAISVIVAIITKWVTDFIIRKIKI